MSPVDDYIRELLAASPQGRIDESFEALGDDPTATQMGAREPGVIRQVPGLNRDLQGVVAEAMQQNPVGTEEMNPVPPRLEGALGDITEDPDAYGPDPESANTIVASRFPLGPERLKTHGWVSSENPETEHDISRYDDLRAATGSRTAGGSAGGMSLPFRLRGPVNMQLDEQQSLISRLLNAFR